MEFRTLEHESAEAVQRCFAEAFADYVVQIDFTLEKYHRHVLRNGVELRHSMGAYRDGKLVGFILNGTGSWNGTRTIYDAGTGVIPQARGQGVTERIFLQLSEHAREQGFEQYLLEVIQSNTPAVKIYQRQGFQTVRELCCFKGKKAGLAGRRPYQVTPLEEMDGLEEFWDAPPSWQNSMDAVRRFRAHLQQLAVRIDGETAGYAVFDPANGDIVQLAVRRDLRGRGVGSSLVAAAADATQAEELRVINIDRGAQSAVGFWSHRLQPHVMQYEMVLALG